MINDNNIIIEIIINIFIVNVKKIAIIIEDIIKDKLTNHLNFLLFLKAKIYHSSYKYTSISILIFNIHFHYN